MARIQRHCQQHPDRQAIGVCVITGESICAECSTRYEGVNYSKRGLEILKARRAAQHDGPGRGERVGRALALLLSPLLLLALFVFFRLGLTLLIDLSQGEVL